ncbi:hypothetical protein [Halomicrobium katesii]|uniref:hypothetical protein n=1 Tax=Halomicrobium katesii TaxID=437163 RepID=UPI00036208DE|nr:hypothetical protein [Halomicrobium katesii]
MSETILDRFVSKVSQSVTEIVVAYLLAFIAGGDSLQLAKIVLAIKLNVFALPLSWTPALRLPLWCWYVTAVLWLRQWLLLSGYSTSEAVGQVERYVGGETA